MILDRLLLFEGFLSLSLFLSGSKANISIPHLALQTQCTVNAMTGYRGEGEDEMALLLLWRIGANFHAAHDP